MADGNPILPIGLTPKEAIELQKSLAALILHCPMPSPGKPLLAAGADCSYEKFATTGYAAIVVTEWPSGRVREIGHAVMQVGFPYVPGLLSFRELPLLDRAMSSLKNRPDLVVIDGQGYAHPRRFGLACHAGLLWGLPSIGCAKSLLVGECEEPGLERGAQAPLLDRGETIGMALRTRRGVKPVYVSNGHRSNLREAADWALRLASRYRLPDVIRLAHAEVNRLRNEAKATEQGVSLSRTSQ